MGKRKKRKTKTFEEKVQSYIESLQKELEINQNFGESFGMKEDKMRTKEILQELEELKKFHSMYFI